MNVADDPPDGRFDVSELLAPTGQRPLRRLPRLVRRSIVLVWRAAPREFVASSLLQLMGAVGVAGQLLAGRHVLVQLLARGGPKSFGTIVPSLVLLAVLTAAVNFSNVAKAEQQRVLSELVSRHAMDQVLDVSTTADLLAYETPAFHNRLQRATVNATVRPYQMASGVLNLLSSLLALVAIGGALLVLAPAFMLLVMVAYVPTWFVTRQASRAAYAYSLAQTERDRRRAYLAKVLTSKEEAKEVRSFGIAAFLRQRYDGLYDQLFLDLRALVRRRLLYGLAGGLATSLLTAGTIAALVYSVTSGRTPLAAAGAAAGAVVLLGQRLQDLSSGAGAIFESSLFVEDFTSFVELLPRIEARRATAPAPQQFSTITVEDVRFVYPSAQRPSLDGISLEIHQGEVVALVGENGSGKTTLAKILGGLYQPSAGRVLWDGTDVATVSDDELRRSVAIIFQDFVRYHLSARENIGIGRWEAFDDIEAIRAAGARAGADGYLNALPEGYETRMGPEFFGGSDLSVGQWQRVALARAFFRDAPLLILDEPTAALDPRAEAALFEDLRSLARGRTVVLISHRFSSVRSADRIFVVDQGRIVESGNHAELLAAGGLYAELFTLQAAAYLGDPSADSSRRERP